VSGPERLPAEFELRAAVPEDGPSVASVFGAARSAMRYLPDLHTPEEHVTYFTEVVLPASRVTVAVTGREVIGFSAVKDGWLDHLYVAPAAQEHGIGGTLLDRAMSENPNGLSLWAFVANRRAIAFYGGAGFEEIRRTDGRDNEEHQPDVLMRWPGARARISDRR
jgi:putative acetyltransferase